MRTTSIDITGQVIEGYFDITIKDPYIEFNSNMTKGFVDLRLVSFCMYNRTRDDALSLIFFLSDGKTSVTFSTPAIRGGPEVVPFLIAFSGAYDHTLKFIKDRETRLQQIAKESAQ